MFVLFRWLVCMKSVCVCVCAHARPCLCVCAGVCLCACVDCRKSAETKSSSFGESQPSSSNVSYGNENVEVSDHLNPLLLHAPIP